MPASRPGAASSTDTLRPFFVIIWAAGREAPLLVCPSHNFALPDDALLSVNAVALYRFFTSLALLSTATSETDDAGTHARHVMLTSSTVTYRGSKPTAAEKKVALPLPCVFGTTPLFHVAVLAAAAAGDALERPSYAAADLLRWVAGGVIASLEPAYWHMSGNVAPPSSSSALQQQQEQHLCSSLHGMPPPLTNPNLAEQLSHYWAAEKTATAMATAAAEEYGAREVLAENNADAASLRALLAVSHADETAEKRPILVETALQTYLTRWWAPFAASDRQGTFHVQLAGYFSLPSTASKPHHNGTEGSSGLQLAPQLFACHPAAAEALSLIASFCQKQQQETRPISEVNGAGRPAAVLAVHVRLSGKDALVAVDTSVLPSEERRVFQVALISDHQRSSVADSAAEKREKSAEFNTPKVLYVDASALFGRGHSTLWCDELLRELF